MGCTQRAHRSLSKEYESGSGIKDYRLGIILQDPWHDEREGGGGVIRA